MFSNGMSESSANIISLPDVRYPVFVALCEYLYTDILTGLFLLEIYITVIFFLKYFFYIPIFFIFWICLSFCSLVFILIFTLSFSRLNHSLDWNILLIETHLISFSIITTSEAHTEYAMELLLESEKMSLRFENLIL